MTEIKTIEDGQKDALFRRANIKKNWLYNYSVEYVVQYNSSNYSLLVKTIVYPIQLKIFHKEFRLFYSVSIIVNF